MGKEKCLTRAVKLETELQITGSLKASWDQVNSITQYAQQLNNYSA